MNKKIWIIVFLILGASVFAGGAYYKMVKRGEAGERPEAVLEAPEAVALENSTSAEINQSAEIKKESEDFFSDRYGFQITYPAAYCLAKSLQSEENFVLEIHSDCPVRAGWRVKKISSHSMERLEGIYGIIIAEKNSDPLDEFIGAHVSMKGKSAVKINGADGYKFDSVCLYNAMHGHLACSETENVWHFKNEKTGYIFTLRGNKNIMENVLSSFRLLK